MRKTDAGNSLARSRQTHPNPKQILDFPIAFSTTNSDAQAVTSPRKPALSFIFITLFLDILGIGLIIPILPKLVEQFQNGDISAASHTVGWLSALYSLAQFLCAPFLGNLSDRFGRRAVILTSLFGSGLDYILLAVAPNLSWFFVGRIISGITGANITAASAYIADVSPPDKRSANFGIIGAAFGLGFIAGPALGGLIGQYGLRLPFWIAAGLTLINWLYGCFVLPESLAPENRRSLNWGRSNPVGSLVNLARWPVVKALATSHFLLNLAQYSLQSTWVLYTGYRYHWSTGQVGASLATVGIMAAVVQGGLARKIIPRLGERRAILWGLGYNSVIMALYGLAPAGWMIYVILVVGALGGIAGPALQGLISRNVPDNEQGGVQGALTSLASIAGIVGPPIGTSLFAWFIRPESQFQIPGISFFVGAMIIAIAFLGTSRVLRSHPNSLPPNS